ncbi:RND superfamily putative drug exporter [Rhodococcus sp. LBL1]|uniref:RND superfamily putative drug exporter n=1 Tax=Prescottella agglutinans TaxID=1644129 RepID=A0ABT6ME05_9NOCA|nr:MMPL family transporter [Prescottella agglutinans]MDH6282517.1 RND superfamily putative drug exporter [Prescottella agglutinans]MDH6679111.1 RND superfamily putative drug exporter [Rhodococcus sp. LBL1]MDH6685149.1 RND superfamily putative drug exporter [Rhodococcus sp. LBL2]
MATYLYRIGRFAYRRKGTVLSIWLAILVLMGVGAATLSGPTKDSFSIPGTPAQQAQDLMAERFADQKSPMDSLSARFVFAAPEGQTLDTPENQAAMDAVIAKVQGIDKVSASAKAEPGTPGALTDPVVADAGLQQMAVASAEQQGIPEDVALANAKALSPLSADRTTGYIEVPFDGKFGDIDQSVRDQIKAAADIGRDAGLNVQISGSAATEAEMPGGLTEIVGIAVAAIVLVITFGSLVAAGLPLITAIIGIMIGSLGITVATGFMDLSSMTPTLAVMIGLAVAIDYSLFIVSRFKHELSLTDDRSEAAGRAVGTAGSAVVFAGLTVIIALVALRVVGIPFLSDMGAAAASTVFIAVLIALTLLPAILGLFGRKAFAGRIRGLSQRDAEGDDPASGKVPFSRRYIGAVVRRPAIGLIAGVLLLGVLAIPAAKLELALPNEGSGDPTTSARQAYDLVNEGFGPGKNGPLLVVVDAQDATVAKPEAFGAVVAKISEQPDVLNAQVVGMNDAGDTAQILVTPRSGPSDPSTMDLVADIRGAESGLHDQIGVNYGVTGQTALEGDVSERLQDALVPYLAVVVGLAFVLLMLVFRSLLVPLTATLGFLLSVVATFGATVAVFQEGWGGIAANPQPIVSFMPIFLIGVVFGLAMDYQVFLVTRMREEYVHGASAKDAVTHGFQHGARVVTAAAIIMISVFAAFIAEPNSFIKSMGFALAAAVFFDAFVVRMLVIPSVMALLGDKAWWLPKWLDKILPNVDIEGEKLARALPREKRELEDATVS